MNHEKLINFLNNYGSLSDFEKENLKKYFNPLQVKKKQILIQKNSPCNQLFFINNGLLRAYYSTDQGNDITRMVAWENRFLTNIGSFKGITENNETIECLENAEILYITRYQFEILLKSSSNLKNIYADILEEYNALRDHSYITREGVSLLGIIEASQKIGFDTLPVKLTTDVLSNEKEFFPCILHWNQNHFVVLQKIKKNLFSKKKNII